MFKPGTSTLAKFARAQMVGGSETAFLLLLGHGVTGDFESAVAGFSKKPDGKSAVTSAIKERAGALSKKMVAMMEERAAIVAKHATRTARSRSESTS